MTVQYGYFQPAVAACAGTGMANRSAILIIGQVCELNMNAVCENAGTNVVQWEKAWKRKGWKERVYAYARTMERRPLDGADRIHR